MIAIIGGTGLSELQDFETDSGPHVETPFGAPSHQPLVGRWAGQKVVFLCRHGCPPRLPPHVINYRANLWALRDLGVDQIIATNVVGSIDSGLRLTEIVIPDQIIDYTYGRAATFFDERIEHIDFTGPYDTDLRECLIAACESLASQQEGFWFQPSSVYACTQGPRLETAAEIRRLGRDGCDVVGMTGMPEAALARELHLAYASVSLVVNKAAGLEGSDSIDIDDLRRAAEAGMTRIFNLLRTVVGDLNRSNS